MNADERRCVGLMKLFRDTSTRQPTAPVRCSHRRRFGLARLAKTSDATGLFSVVNS
jgi:hypothetical protein